MNSGEEFIAELSDSEGSAAAAVIALTPENKVVVARQFRAGPNKIMDELPGGHVEKGEDPEMTAIRELKEETGYEIGRISKLGEVYKNAYIQAKWHYYLAEDCRPGGSMANPDAGEEIEVDLISITQLFSNAHTSKMSDTEALFFAYEKLKELEGK